MRMLVREEQQKIFKALIEIQNFITPIEGREALDKLRDIEMIAAIVGGSQMVKDLGGSK